MRDEEKHWMPAWVVLGIALGPRSSDRRCTVPSDERTTLQGARAPAETLSA